MRSIAVIILAFATFGCKKAEFKRYTGKYNVRHFTHIWKSGEPTEYIIEDETINIFRNSDYVELVGKLVHIDSLEKDVEYYSGTPENHFTLQFINDSVYYYTISSTENGGTINSYEGSKIK